MHSARHAVLPRRADTPGDAPTLAQRWDLIVEAADLVARMAGDVGDPGGLSSAELAALDPRDYPDWRGAAAERLIGDVAATMACGIGALVSAEARGGVAPAAARALWHEYAEARTKLRGLLDRDPTGASTAN